MSKNAGVATVAIIALSAIVITLIIVLANQHGSSQSSTQSSPSQDSTSATQTNQALQNCIDHAHQQWDGDIATAEGTPGNAYAFDKSQLDQQIVMCHQQYGY